MWDVAVKHVRVVVQNFNELSGGKIPTGHCTAIG